MELNSSISGAAITASVSPADRIARSTGPSRQGLQSTVRRVPGVVVELSHEAAAQSGQAAEGGAASAAVDLSGNPLSGGELASVMVDAQERLFGDEVEALERGSFNVYENEAQAEARQSAGPEAASASQDDGSGSPDGLSEEERQMVDQLAARDRAVRAHELAHVGAAGGLAGAPVFSYQTGPDGKRYAVGGHVSIDTSPGRTNEETISKAQRIRAAALAPADPSGADRAVAARASQMETQARAAESRSQAREAREALANVAEAAEAASADPSGEAVSLPELPAVDLDAASSAPELGEVEAPEPVRLDVPDLAPPPEQLGGVVVGGSVATLASPSLSAFQGGTASEAQLMSPSEADLVGAYLAASRLQSPTQNPALRLAMM